MKRFIDRSSGREWVLDLPAPPSGGEVCIDGEVFAVKEHSNAVLAARAGSPAPIPVVYLLPRTKSSGG
jgi:hypothetical protein